MIFLKCSLTSSCCSSHGINKELSYQTIIAVISRTSNLLPGKLRPEGGVEPAVQEGVVAGGGHGDDVGEEEGDVVVGPTSCRNILQTVKIFRFKIKI